MATLASLVVQLTAQNQQFVRAMDQSQKKTRAFQAGVTKLGATMAGVFTFAVALRGFRALAKAVEEGERSQAKLEAVLKATGGTAQRTSRQLNELANSLARTTLFTDDQIRNSQAILLTFKGIQGVNFDRTVSALLDMSEVLDQDLRTGAVQLGKALNDPLTGLTALRRSGVSFTAAQTEAIKKMVEFGQTARAQALILDELETQFGGAAAGANTGLTGAVTQFTKAWGDMIEALGRAPSVQGGFSGILGFFQGIFEVITRIATQLPNAGLQLTANVQALANPQGAFNFLTGSPGAVSPALQSLINQYQGGLTGGVRSGRKGPINATVNAGSFRGPLGVTLPDLQNRRGGSLEVTGQLVNIQAEAKKFFDLQIESAKLHTNAVKEETQANLNAARAAEFAALKHQQLAVSVISSVSAMVNNLIGGGGGLGGFLTGLGGIASVGLTALGGPVAGALAGAGFGALGALAGRDRGEPAPVRVTNFADNTVPADIMQSLVQIIIDGRLAGSGRTSDEAFRDYLRAEQRFLRRGGGGPR